MDNPDKIKDVRIHKFINDEVSESEHWAAMKEMSSYNGAAFVLSRVGRSLAVVLAALLATACHSVEDWDNTYADNFDLLWTTFDQHYCYFAEKDVDWQEVYDRYRPRIGKDCTRDQLFHVCSEMLAELRDGHVNLATPFETSYYRKWWTDYPQNYDERLVQEHYLHFDYRSVSGSYYAMLMPNIGYLRYPSFAYPLGEGNLDAILSYFVTCSGLIIDIRDNGGGDLTNVEPIVSRFIERTIPAGYIIHKTGPGHNDFSEPFAYEYKPAPETRQHWVKPVVILTNRSTFSAANNFTAIMKSLPQVTIVGARTGGGGGMPYSSELPCGWSVRFSACPILDPDGHDTEHGVEPDVAVDLDPQLALQGIDTMLEQAISILSR